MESKVRMSNCRGERVNKKHCYIAWILGVGFYLLLADLLLLQLIVNR